MASNAWSWKSVQPTFNASAIDFDPWDIIPDASPPPPPSVAAFPAPLTFDRSFLFGVATAPAHVEDELEDAWLPFCKVPGNCHAWLTTPKASERLRFWTHPEVEIDLAADLNSNVFRMGVDWSRLAPRAPSHFSNSSTPACDAFCKQHEADAAAPPRPLDPAAKSPPPPPGCACSGVQDQAAVRRYAEIAQIARAKGMKVVITLFHHSLPVWVGEAGGWLRVDLVRKAAWENTKVHLQKGSETVPIPRATTAHTPNEMAYEMFLKYRNGSAPNMWFFPSLIPQAPFPLEFKSCRSLAASSEDPCPRRDFSLLFLLLFVLLFVL